MSLDKILPEDELLSQTRWEFVNDIPNDPNRHLNCAQYLVYCERVRDLWLVKFGWTNEEFNRQGIVMLRHQWIAPKHYGELTHGDKFAVDLRVYKTGSRRFSMAFDFYRHMQEHKPKEEAEDKMKKETRDERVFSLDGTEDYFADATKTPKRIITLPDFFLKALRN